MWKPKPKQKKALWFTIKHGTETPEKKPKFTNSVSKRLRQKKMAYQKEARAFVLFANQKCPVVAAIPVLRERLKDGLISDRVNQVHHVFGKIGRLRLWKPGWIALSSAGHDWVHKENPAEAIRLGFLSEVFNDFDWAVKRLDEIVARRPK